MKRFKVVGAAVLGASLLLAGCLATTGLFYSRVSSDSRVVQYRPDQTRPDQTRPDHRGNSFYELRSRVCSLARFQTLSRLLRSRLLLRPPHLSP